MHILAGRILSSTDVVVGYYHEGNAPQKDSNEHFSAFHAKEMDAEQTANPF